MNLFKVAFYLPFLRGHIFALPFYSHSSATIGEFSAAIFSEFDSTFTLIVYIWPSSCSTKPQYGYPYPSLAPNPFISSISSNSLLSTLFLTSPLLPSLFLSSRCSADSRFIKVLYPSTTFWFLLQQRWPCYRINQPGLKSFGSRRCLRWQLC